MDTGATGQPPRQRTLPLASDVRKRSARAAGRLGTGEMGERGGGREERHQKARQAGTPGDKASPGRGWPCAVGARKPGGRTRQTTTTRTTHTQQSGSLASACLLMPGVYSGHWPSGPAMATTARPAVLTNAGSVSFYFIFRARAVRLYCLILGIASSGVRSFARTGLAMWGAAGAQRAGAQNGLARMCSAAAVAGRCPRGGQRESRVERQSSAPPARQHGHKTGSTGGQKTLYRLQRRAVYTKSGSSKRAGDKRKT